MKLNGGNEIMNEFVKEISWTKETLNAFSWMKQNSRQEFMDETYFILK